MSRGWACVGRKTMEGQTGATGQWLRHPTGMSHANITKEQGQEQFRQAFRKTTQNIWCSNMYFKYDWSSD